MTTLWVILNDAKDAVIEVFETNDADSRRHWDKFFNHKAGTVFCRRINTNPGRKDDNTWYYSYYYWSDMTRWGYEDPDGIGWSACMAIPEILKVLEFLE